MMAGVLSRLVPAAVPLALAAVFLVWSYAYDGRAHTVPMLIGWCAVVLTILDIVAQTETAVGKFLNGLLSGRPLDSSTSADGAETGAAPALVACAWIAGFVALVGVVGFIAAIPVYTLAFMRLQGRRPWRHAVITAILITAVTWIVFEQLLRYKVFEGVIFGGQF